jgi:hypothetical protein
MLTMLEGAIKRDYLSADFEVTTEWLNLSSQDIAHQSSGPHSASATVLPWVPNTTAAVALRLLDLDSAIAYTNNPKAGSNKEQESRDFTVSLVACGASFFRSWHMSLHIFVVIDPLVVLLSGLIAYAEDCLVNIIFGLTHVPCAMCHVV